MIVQSALGEVAEIIRGVTFGQADVAREPTDGSIPVLRAGNIADELYLEDDLVFVRRELISRSQLLREGDIVICTSSGSASVVGKSAILKRPWNGSFGAFCAAVRARTEKIEANYLAHFLRSPYFRAWTSRAQGANIKNLRVSELQAFPVNCPPPGEQRRIAAILDKADAIRRKRRHALVEVDALLRSAYQSLVSSAHPNFPRWKKWKFEELASDRPGALRTGPFGSDLRHSEFVDEGIAVLGIDNAVTNTFAWDERRFITPEKFGGLRRYRVDPGDVIVTIMGTTGRSAVVPDDIPEAITTKHLATISLNRERALPEFIAFSIHSDPRIVRQIKRANKGAIMDGLNLGIIRRLEIALPPIEDQRRFGKVYKRLNGYKARLQLPDARGDELFNSLAHRAFRGEL